MKNEFILKLYKYLLIDMIVIYILKDNKFLQNVKFKKILIIFVKYVINFFINEK